VRAEGASRQRGRQCGRLPIPVSSFCRFAPNFTRNSGRVGLRGDSQGIMLVDLIRLLVDGVLHALIAAPLAVAFEFTMRQRRGRAQTGKFALSEPRADYLVALELVLRELERERARRERAERDRDELVDAGPVQTWRLRRRARRLRGPDQRAVSQWPETRRTSATANEVAFEADQAWRPGGGELHRRETAPEFAVS
jgi:hypothetical protein